MNPHSPRELLGVSCGGKSSYLFGYDVMGRVLGIPWGTYPLGHAPGKLRGSLLLCLRAEDL